MVEESIAIDQIELSEPLERFVVFQIENIGLQLRMPPPDFSDVLRIPIRDHDLAVAVQDEWSVKPNSSSHLQDSLSFQVEPKRGQMLLPCFVYGEGLGGQKDVELLTGRCIAALAPTDQLRDESAAVRQDFSQMIAGVHECLLP